MVKIKHSTKVNDFYPVIRQKLNEIDDPDVAWDFLNICIANGALSKGKAQKFFDARFPKEVLDLFRAEILKRVAGESEFEKVKREAIAERRKAIEAMGLNPEAFEKEMDQLMLEQAQKEGQIQ